MQAGVFFFSSRRRHTRWPRDWSSDVCSSDLTITGLFFGCFGCLGFTVTGFQLGNGHGQGFTLALAPNFHFGLGTWLGGANNTWQVAHLLDLFTIEIKNHVTATYPCLGSRTILFDVAH